MPGYKTWVNDNLLDIVPLATEVIEVEDPKEFRPIEIAITIIAVNEFNKNLTQRIIDLKNLLAEKDNGDLREKITSISQQLIKYYEDVLHTQLLSNKNLFKDGFYTLSDWKRMFRLYAANRVIYAFFEMLNNTQESLQKKLKSKIFNITNSAEMGLSETIIDSHAQLFLIIKLGQEELCNRFINAAKSFDMDTTIVSGRLEIKKHDGILRYKTQLLTCLGAYVYEKSNDFSLDNMHMQITVWDSVLEKIKQAIANDEFRNKLAFSVIDENNKEKDNVKSEEKLPIVEIGKGNDRQVESQIENASTKEKFDNSSSSKKSENSNQKLDKALGKWGKFFDYVTIDSSINEFIKQNKKFVLGLNAEDLKAFIDTMVLVYEGKYQAFIKNENIFNEISEASSKNKSNDLFALNALDKVLNCMIIYIKEETDKLFVSEKYKRTALEVNQHWKQKRNIIQTDFRKNFIASKAIDKKSFSDTGLPTQKAIANLSGLYVYAYNGDFSPEKVRHKLKLSQLNDFLSSINNLEARKNFFIDVIISDYDLKNKKNTHVDLFNSQEVEQEELLRFINLMPLYDMPELIFDNIVNEFAAKIMVRSATFLGEAINEKVYHDQWLKLRSPYESQENKLKAAREIVLATLLCHLETEKNVDWLVKALNLPRPSYWHNGIIKTNGIKMPLEDYIKQIKSPEVLIRALKHISIGSHDPSVLINNGLFFFIMNKLISVSAYGEVRENTKLKERFMNELVNSNYRFNRYDILVENYPDKPSLLAYLNTDKTLEYYALLVQTMLDDFSKKKFIGQETIDNGSTKVNNLNIIKKIKEDLIKKRLELQSRLQEQPDNQLLKKNLEIINNLIVKNDLDKNTNLITECENKLVNYARFCSGIHGKYSFPVTCFFNILPVYVQHSPWECAVQLGMLFDELPSYDAMESITANKIYAVFSQPGFLESFTKNNHVDNFICECAKVSFRACKNQDLDTIFKELSDINKYFKAPANPTKELIRNESLAILNDLKISFDAKIGKDKVLLGEQLRTFLKNLCKLDLITYKFDQKPGFFSRNSQETEAFLQVKQFIQHINNELKIHNVESNRNTTMSLSNNITDDDL